MRNDSLSYVLSVSSTYILKDKRKVLIFLSASFIAAFTTILLPYLLGYFTDDVVLNKNINLLYPSIIVIVISIILGQLSSVISGVYSTRIHGDAYISYNLDILAHVQNLPLAFFNDKDSAYITKRINDDTEEVISLILGNFVSLTIDAITVLCIVSILFIKFHLTLPLIFLCTVATDILLFLYFKTIIYNIYYIKKELQNDYFASLNESIFKIKFIKAHNINEFMQSHLANKFQFLLESFIKFGKASYSHTSLSKFIRRLSIVFVLIICANGIFSGDITAGDFVLSVTYFMLGFSCLDNFPELAQKWQNVSVSIDRINTILNQKTDHNGDATLQSIHIISLNDISYCGDNHHPILKNFSYTFKQKYVYVITGSNGAGKSTLLNIIIGLLPTERGEISYNNIPAHELDTRELRSHHISYCDQTDDFLNMSIKQNIMLNNTKIDNNYLSLLVEQFGLEGKMNGGTLSIEGPVDIKLLSGGEKRKISIIRTLLKDSDVYIFDEPTIALDTRGIKTFKDIVAIKKLNKIIIIVTHDKSLIEIADFVLKL